MRAVSAAGRQPRALKLVVGLNAAVDVILPALDFFQAANITIGDLQSVHNYDALANREALAGAFAHVFRHGVAAERPYTDAAGFAQLARTASNLPSAVHFTGGNAALMGAYLAERGHQVTLVAAAGPHLRRLLPPAMLVPEVTHQDSDEYHLILEYGKGQQWQGFTAARANRFIFSHDRSNAELRPLQHLLTVVEQAQPDMVVVSGVHMLDGESEDTINQRVQVKVHGLYGEKEKGKF